MSQEQDFQICVEVEAFIDEAMQGGALELPVLPMVASEVLTTSMSDEVNAEQVSTLIQQDQSMAAHVLRVVNSPAFRGATEIVALQQAIARLGLNYIREIAVTVALSGTQFKHKEYQAVAERAWNLALAAGLWTKEIARTGRKNVEVAYLCGLLHNIGVPLLLKLVREASEQILNEAQLTRVLNAKTAAVSLMLAESWQIPGPMQVAIAQWNNTQYIGEHQEVALTTRAGIKMANWMLDSELELSRIVDCTEIQALDIYPEDAEQLMELQEKISSAMESIR